MNEEMARFFGDAQGGQTSQMTWMPAIDVQQRDGRMIVSAELPGMQPGDVNIEVADDALVIQGERRDDRDQDRGGFHVTERRYGRFYRAVPLPEGAKTDAVSARFNNGIRNRHSHRPTTAKLAPADSHSIGEYPTSGRVKFAISSKPHLVTGVLHENSPL